MTPEAKANSNIFLVLRKLKRLQIENSSQNVVYKLGGLMMSFDEELAILNMLQKQQVIQIGKSYGNNSSR